MILWIDEWGNAHETETLDDGMIKAIKDDIISVYRFVLTINSVIEGAGTYQQHNGTDWIPIGVV